MIRAAIGGRSRGWVRWTGAYQAKLAELLKLFDQSTSSRWHELNDVVHDA